MNQNNEGVLGYWNRDTVTIGGLPVSNQAFAQGNCFTDTACPNLQSSDPKAKFDVSVLILISVFNIYIQFFNTLIAIFHYLIGIASLILYEPSRK